MSLSVGASLLNCARRKRCVSSRMAAAIFGLNSGNTCGEMVKSAGSLISSQAVMKRWSLSRAGFESTIDEIVALASAPVRR